MYAAHNCHLKMVRQLKDFDINWHCFSGESARSNSNSDSETEEEEYDEADVDIAYYKEKVAWVVIDEAVEENELMAGRNIYRFVIVRFMMVNGLELSKFSCY